MEREINSLLSIKDGYKKMIITRLNHESYLHEGIECICQVKIEPYYN